MRLAVVAFSLAVWVLACRTEEVVRPAPRDETSSSSGSGGAGGGGPAVRSVFTRSPWGGPAESLLVDGDFELSISMDGHEGPNGWYAFDRATSATKYLRGETGGLCHTGLRCAVLDSTMVLFGRGTAAPNAGGVSASVWAKPPAGKGCAVVVPSLMDCDQAIYTVKLKPAAAEPDADGWCSYAATIPKTATKRCLYIDSKLEKGERALVDSAVVLPLAAPMADHLPEPASEEHRERARRIVRRIRDLTPLGGRERPPEAQVP